MFGFAASFKDSVACQTSIQQVDDAWIEPSHQFLVDRSLYSLQLQNHMATVQNCENAISTVFFSTKLSKLQRTWRKVHKRYERAEGLRFSVIPQEDFAFTAEEYREIVIGDGDESSAETARAPKPGRDKKMQ